MTRIVAGKAGGRRLRVPPKGTRPTAERVREALFNALDVAGELGGASVLDLYAGSGALGFEALSRGARDVLFVESDRKAVDVLRANAGAIGLGGTVRHGKVESVVAEPAVSAFDLVVADPPYAVDSASLATVLGGLVDNGWLAMDALVIVERATREGEPPWPEALRPLRVKRYGDTALFWAEYCVTSRA